MDPEGAKRRLAMDITKGPTGRIKRLRQLLSGMSRADVVVVLERFSLQKAAVYGFADSTDFDLVHEGKTFPPKAVLGLAAERVVGRPLTADEFSGGESSACFAVLRGLGFDIEPKAMPQSTDSSSSSTGTGGTQLLSSKRYPFTVGSRYHRRDVFRVLGIEDPGGGPMYTGYAAHGDDCFIFCGVDSAGRTGHDYKNRFIGEDLLWHGRNGSRLTQRSIQGLLNPTGHTYIFFRGDNRDAFTFAGVGTPKEVRDVSPVEVLWTLQPCRSDDPDPGLLPEEIALPTTVIEGAKKSITVNAYERDRDARKRCIEHWGLACVVCGFDFERQYGDIGVGFIHVHHLKPLAEIGQEYTLDPVADLRPVCPNCHAMLHRGDDVLSVDTLRARMRANTN